MDPKLSVIIPTHKRASILAECLRHLESQTIVSDIEVIVVSDGHDEETAALSKNLTSNYPLLTTNYFEIPKSQQGVARNKGVSEARGSYVLFIGDDIFLDPMACARHVEIHKKGDQWFVASDKQVLPTTHYSLPTCHVAVLGFTTWDPAVGITPVMTWLETSGWQFGYRTLNRSRATDLGGFIPEALQHRYTYTSHISLPLELAKKHPFQTDVHLYGWEDIEWGMRLRDAGVRLFYEPSAKALHHHRITLEESLKRMDTLGRSAVEIKKVVLEFDRVPTGWKLLAYRVFAFLPTMAGRHRRAFLKGLSLK